MKDSLIGPRPDLELEMALNTVGLSLQATELIKTALPLATRVNLLAMIAEALYSNGHLEEAENYAGTAALAGAPVLDLIEHAESLINASRTIQNELRWGGFR